MRWFCLDMNEKMLTRTLQCNVSIFLISLNTAVSGVGLSPTLGTCSTSSSKKVEVEDKVEHVPSVALMLRVCQEFFLRVLPFLSHLVIGLSHI